jgi:hypothetical protein
VVVGLGKSKADQPILPGVSDGASI